MPARAALALVVAGAVAAAAALSTLAGRDAPTRRAPPPAAAPETSPAATSVDAPLAELPPPPAAIAQAVVVTVDGDCRARQRTLGDPAFDRDLVVRGFVACGAAWSPDARWSATVDIRYLGVHDPVPRVVLLDRATGRLATYDDRDGALGLPSLAVATDGRVAACFDGRTTRLFPGPARLPGCTPAFAGGRLLVAREDGAVVDAQGRTVVPSVLLPPSPRVLAMAASPDGTHVGLLVGSMGRGYLVVAPVGDRGPVLVHDLGPSAVAAGPLGSGIVGVVVAPGGRAAFGVLGDVRVAVAFGTGAVASSAGGSPLRAVAFSPDGGTALLSTPTSTYVADAGRLRPVARAAFGAEAIIWPVQVAPRG